jgi:hypothetical protein
MKRLNNTGFSNPNTDLYSILNLSSDATISEIQRQFRQMSLFIHPDKTGRGE